MLSQALNTTGLYNDYIFRVCFKPKKFDFAHQTVSPREASRGCGLGTRLIWSHAVPSGRQMRWWCQRTLIRFCIARPKAGCQNVSKGENQYSCSQHQGLDQH